MISQNVITASLIGIALTGVIPIVGGLILLAIGKIKGSSFWAGVLACIIGIIVALIPTAILGISAGVISSADGSGGTSVSATDTPIGINIISQIITGICLALAMGICVRSCMKTRTFKAALSCGLGFAATMAVITGISLTAMYITFSSINSGAFDQQYAQYVKMGAISKEMVVQMKEVYTVITAPDLYQSALTTASLCAALAGCGILIMRFVCKKQAFLGMCAAAGVLSLSGIGSILPNAFAAIIVSAAVGAAALIFALRMKEDIVPPAPVTAADDPFMSAVEDAQKRD